VSVDYEWRLRVVMAEHGMFKANELTPRLAEHGIRLSDSQVWRMVTGRPERLNLRVLVVLCEIFDCDVNELVRSVETAKPRAKEPASAGAIKKGLRPKQARLGHPGA
jgi:DNA-binding Xre family transcriptional regulator